MASRSHPPAWYRDPGDPGRVRRWDGRGWTADVRPIPDWLRTLHLSSGPRSPLPGTTRRLWVVSAALLTLGAVLMLALRADGGGEDHRVGDHDFVRLANQRCAAAEAEAIAPHRTRGGAADGERLEAMAAGWDAMVRDLRRLPVQPGDSAKVDRWLAAWERWVSLRHRFAAEVAAGDERGSRLVLQASQESKRAINSFASANGMTDCIFA